MYYDNLYIECYYFYQQYEDNYVIAGSLDYKYVSFIISFLKEYDSRLLPIV